LKERQDQLKRVIETTDIIQG